VTAERPSTLIENATSAMLAGMTSGLVSGPAESVILQQQFTGASAIPTFKRMAGEAGALSVYRGTPYAMFRDGVFTAGFMALGPFLSAQFKTLFADKDGSVSSSGEVGSRLLGGATAGVIAAVATHPADTIKTRFQSDFRGQTYPSLRAVCAEGGLFKGLSARGLRVIIGVCIISNFTDIARQKAREWQSAAAAQQQTVTH
jgi:hypothetical protein